MACKLKSKLCVYVEELPQSGLWNQTDLGWIQAPSGNLLSKYLLTEFLLYARPSAQCWGYSSDQNRKVTVLTKLFRYRAKDKEISEGF